MMRLFFVYMGALVLSAVNLPAAPLPPGDVSPDPALLLHVDIDALLQTSVGKAIVSSPDIQSKLAAVKAAFNFDLATQLHGFTIYTTLDEPTNGVLIVNADFDSNRLITIAQAFPRFETSTYASQPVYSWVDDKKKTDGVKPRIYAAIEDHRVVFSKSSPILSAALDVFRGKAPGMPASAVPPAAEPGEKLVVLAMAKRFAFDSKDPNAAILKMSKSAVFQLGEANDQVVADVKLTAKDDDAALQIAQIVTGLKALFALNKDPNLSQLANGLHLEQEGSSVNLKLSLPSANVIDFIHKQQQSKEHESGAGSQ